MRVILLQNIKGFGRIGDVKNVSDGYGKNFLFPNKLAKLATPAALKTADALKAKAEIILKEEKDRAQEIANRLKDASIEIVRKASKTGTLFASLTKKEIVKELKDKFSVDIEEPVINLKEHGEHIKHVGEHLIDLDLAEGITAPLKITIKEE